MHRFRFYVQAIEIGHCGHPEGASVFEWAPTAAAALAQAKTRPGLTNVHIHPDDFAPCAVMAPGETAADAQLLNVDSPDGISRDERAHVLAILALQSGARTAADVVAFLDPANGMDPAKAFGAKVTA